MITEPPHDKINKMACAPSEDSDQPVHLPSLIRVFTARIKKAWVLSYPLSAQRRLWSDWVDAQADLSSLGAVILLVLSSGSSILCAYRENSDQLVHLHTLICLGCPHEEALGP